MRTSPSTPSPAGWTGTGSGTARSRASCRCRTGNRHLLLGPWDHGARINVSPFRDAEEPRFDVLAEVLRFFDHYLYGPRHRARLPRRQCITSRCARKSWRAAPGWPPADRRRNAVPRRRQHAGVGADGRAARTDYKVDFAWGTRQQYSGRAPRCPRYPRPTIRIGRGATRPCSATPRSRCPRRWRSPDIPIVSLWIAASQGDAAIFAYLSEVEPDGRVRYVTEGVLRAIHRQEIRTRALPALELAVPRLQPGEGSADDAGTGGADSVCAAADLLGVPRRQPNPACHLGRGQGSFCADATWPATRSHSKVRRRAPFRARTAGPRAARRRWRWMNDPISPQRRPSSRAGRVRHARAREQGERYAGLGYWDRDRLGGPLLRQPARGPDQRLRDVRHADLP